MPKPVSITRSEWITQANCRGMNPELFFPSHENGRVRFKIDEQAKKACEECPVLEQCADWAVKHEAHGFQGGLTEQQRAQIRRRLNIILWEPQHNITNVTPARSRARVLPPIAHGTPRGYKQERARGMGTCEACTAAHTQQGLASKAKRRAADKANT